ncbi:hypothetical protein G9272_35200 [Streptomyces asoensis]|uniref:Uncharacterized protein n=1 Tax=Streptomyces asoensis TaxID=249586 RepID=A0A6M4X9S8_9ACTN|nr:hypothetical protein [Streptomyces asoensis]QJT04903.1 hypothetical protein G9272_35200 [Streptomyces asoensis]
MRPARYVAAVPLVTSARHKPDEPVPVERAVHAVHDPAAAGARRGKPWSTSRFRLVGHVLEQGAGRRAEAVIGPVFRSKGLPYDGVGVPSGGVPPRNGT